MKIKIRTDRVHRALLLVLFLIFGNCLEAKANMALDRQYAIESVGYLKAWDNVDGLFADYVAEAYEEYFSQESRFRLVDVSEALKVIDQSKLSYQKVIGDKELLKQITRTMKAESLIRTKVFKEGPHYRFVLDWFHASNIELLSTYEFNINEPSKGQSLSTETIKDHLKKGLDQLILKVPFIGNVTGRDDQWITVNLGYQSDVRPGDTLVISTLEAAMVHPLLKSIVDWRFKEVGQASVTDVDGGIAFAKITTESDKIKLQRYQKVTRVIPRKEEAKSGNSLEYLRSGQTGLLANSKDSRIDIPRFGYATIGPWIGFYSRTYSNSTTSQEASGVLFGPEASLQLWFTPNLFADIDFGYGFMSLGSITRFQMAAGYRYYITGRTSGPFIWARMGYHSISYSLTISATNLTEPSSFGGIFLGLGGEIPFSDDWSLVMSFDFGLFKSVSTTGGISTGTSLSSSDVNAFIGAHKRLSPKLGLRAGISLMAHGADFTGSINFNQKVIAIGPSLLYYF